MPFLTPIVNSVLPGIWRIAARPVVEALRRVERGEPVAAVLLDLARPPAGGGRPRFPLGGRIVAVASAEG